MSEDPLTVAPTVRDLPANLAREIGRVVVSYAALEHRLSVALYALLSVSQPEGRLAVTEPRATERFSLVLQLMELKGIVTGEDTKTIREAVEAVQTQRDQLAHGIWLKHPKTGDYYLRVTKGHWQPVPGQKGKTNRKIIPESVPVDAADCRTLRRLIETTIDVVDVVGRDIDAGLRSLRRKSRPQLPEQGRTRYDAARTPPDRPKSSEG